MNKMDKASILGDAIDYVNDLKQQVERAQCDVQSSNVSPRSSDQETDSMAFLLDAAAKYASNCKYLIQTEERCAPVSKDAASKAIEDVFIKNGLKVTGGNLGLDCQV